MAWLVTGTAAAAGEPGRTLFVSDVKMRDGVLLSADVYLPPGAGPFPTVLVRTPYDPRLHWLLETAGRLTGAGYAVVIGHCRGRYDSQGTFTPFKKEGADGYDTVEWVARQPWCNGRIGTMGASYQGICQWLLASKRNPRVGAMFITAAPSDLYDQLAHPGGSFALSGQAQWHFLVSRRVDQPSALCDWKAALATLPASEVDLAVGAKLPCYREFLRQDRPGRFWQSLYDIDRAFYREQCPIFIVGGWNDPMVAGSLDTYSRMRRALASRTDAGERLRCLIGPWNHLTAIRGSHTTCGDVDYGPAAAVDIDGEAIAWFDRWLKASAAGLGSARPADRPLRVFVTGIGKWQEMSDWPDSKPSAYYLHGQGSGRPGALKENPPAAEPADTFVYRPAAPLPSVMSVNLNFGSGPKETGQWEARADALSYESEPLSADLTVIGTARLRLFVETEAPDADFTAWLCQVEESGRSLALRDGVARLSAAGKSGRRANGASRVEITFGPMAHVFRAGSRLKVIVSSSNFPAYERNTSVGADGQTARQTVHHSADRPSCLLLPVSGGVPAGGNQEPKL